MKPVTEFKPSQYESLSGLLGEKLFCRIASELVKLDSSDTKSGAKVLLSGCDRFVFIKDLTPAKTAEKPYRAIAAHNVREFVRSKSFLRLAEIYGRRTSTVLERMVRGLLEIAEKNPDAALRCAKIFGRDEFRRFISDMFSAVKDSVITELMISFSLLAASGKPELIEAFASFVWSDAYVGFMKRYSRYRAELADITRKSALLLLNFPARDDFRAFITHLAATDTYYHWTELFADMRHRDAQTRKIWSANEYLAWLFYYVFLLGKWNTEFRRSLAAVMDPDISPKIRGGRHGQFKGIVNLVNSAVFFGDAYIFRIFVEYYCRFNARDEIRREIFGIGADIVLSGELKPSRRKAFLSFFLSPSYEALFKELRQSSVDTLLFLSHVSAFSLRYETGEFFKVIDEQKLLDLLLSTAKRDRLYRNYLQLFTYIERNFESRTLRMKLIVFFYFHYSQIAMGKTHSQAVYLSPRHLDLTETLMKREMRAVQDPWFKLKSGAHDEGDAAVSWLAGGKKGDEEGGTWYYRDDELDHAVFLLRLDIITAIMGAKRLDAVERKACNYLLDLAGNMKMEDGLYTALPRIIANGDLLDYYFFIREKFVKDPYSIGDYLVDGGFYRVYFREHRAYILRMLVPVLGMIPVKESEWAKTDNRNIYLPQFVREFDDRIDRENLYENRNVGLYLYLGLHEFSHWFAKSFEYDYRQYLIDHTPNPKQAFSIFNLIEDYRSEAVLLRAQCSENYRTILTEARKYYAQVAALSSDTGTKFFQIVSFELYWEERLEIAMPELSDSVREFKSLPVGDERLAQRGIVTMESLIDFVTDSVRSMPTASSRHAIHLAAEVFNMLNRVINLDVIDVRSAGMEHTPAGEKTMSDTGLPQLEGGGGKLQGEGDDTDDKSGDPRGGEDDDSDGKGCGDDGEDGGGEKGDDRPDKGKDRSGGELSPEADLERKRKLSELYRELDSVRGAPEAGEQGGSDEPSGSLMDESRRTLSDNFEAERMIDASLHDQPFIQPGDVSSQCSEETRRREEKRRRRAEEAKLNPDTTVLSYNGLVGGYTDMREIQVYDLSGKTAAFDEMLRPYRSIVDRLLEMISRLSPRTQGKVAYSETEGDIDTERFIETQAAMRSGDGRADLFRGIEKNDFERMGVYIGLDASGSTEGEIFGGLKIIDVERIFAWILGSAFTALGAYVVYRAFNSMTATNVYRLRDADALSGVTPGSANRDGDFLRYMVKEMDRDGFGCRYFFMLSDGAPSAPNYEGENAVADTAMAMNEVVRSGAKLIYFNIDPSCSEYFGLFASQSTYAENFSNPTELIGKAREMVMGIVAGEL